MCAGTVTPASDNIVGARSMRLTRSSTVVPRFASPIDAGSRIISGTRRPES